MKTELILQESDILGHMQEHRNFQAPYTSPPSKPGEEATIPAFIYKPAPQGETKTSAWSSTVMKTPPTYKHPMNRNELNIKHRFKMLI